MDTYGVVSIRWEGDGGLVRHKFRLPIHAEDIQHLFSLETVLLMDKDGCVVHHTDLKAGMEYTIELPALMPPLDVSSAAPPLPLSVSSPYMYALPPTECSSSSSPIVSAPYQPFSHGNDYTFLEEQEKRKEEEERRLRKEREVGHREKELKQKMRKEREEESLRKEKEKVLARFFATLESKKKRVRDANEERTEKEEESKLRKNAAERKSGGKIADAYPGDNISDPAEPSDIVVTIPDDEDNAERLENALTRQEKRKRVHKARLDVMEGAKETPKRCCSGLHFSAPCRVWDKKRRENAINTFTCLFFMTFVPIGMIGGFGGPDYTEFSQPKVCIVLHPDICFTSRTTNADSYGPRTSTSYWSVVGWCAGLTASPNACNTTERCTAPLAVGVEYNVTRIGQEFSCYVSQNCPTLASDVIDRLLEGYGRCEGIYDVDVRAVIDEDRYGYVFALVMSVIAVSVLGFMCLVGACVSWAMPATG